MADPKPVDFLGTSLDDLRAFPITARREAGHQIDQVQSGQEPDDWRPMNTVGQGVKEIRIRDVAGAFRVVYVAKFADAKFVSTAVKPTGKDTADVTGDLTIAGVTKPVVVKATFLGEGKDPWGGYRAGFEGTTSIKRSDFGKMMDLGPQSDTMDLDISFEGVKAK